MSDINSLQEINVAELRQKITILDSRIKESHPLMPVLLREIHTTLRNQPDNVTLLTDAEIGILVSGLQKQTNNTLVAKVLKTKTKSAKSITVDDL